MASENSSKGDDSKAITVTLGKDDEGSLSILSQCISSSVGFFTEQLSKGTLNNGEKVKQTTHGTVATEDESTVEREGLMTTDASMIELSEQLVQQYNEQLMTSSDSVREISANISAKAEKRHQKLKSNKKKMLAKQDNMDVMKIDEVKEMLLKIMLSPNPKKTAAAELMAIDAGPRRKHPVKAKTSKQH